MMLALVWMVCVKKPNSFGGGFGCVYFTVSSVSLAWVLAHQETASDDVVVLHTTFALSIKFITEVVKRVLFDMGIHRGGLACRFDNREGP